VNKGASQYVKLFDGNKIGNLTFWLPHVNETGIFSTDFRETLSVKFHEHPFSGIRFFYGRPDMTKLIVAFRNFANVHKNGRSEESKSDLYV